MQQGCDAWAPRATCHRCQRPGAMCLCQSIPTLDNRTAIWIVQHPRERFHPVGTARLLELALGRARLDVAWLRDGPPPPSGQPVAGRALLYPAPNARALESLSPAERPTELVVLDGTWHQARTLYKGLPWLRALPCVKLGSPEPSRYRIRLEPNAQAVSTLEAVVAALGVLEPELAGLDALLRAFDTMIDRQLEFVTARPGPPRRRLRRPRAFRALPRGLAERFADLVVCYAETAPGSDATERRLVQLVALRAGSGELFERVVRQAAPRGLWHMGLDEYDLERGCELGALGEAWSAFRRKNDIVAAWNQSTLCAMRSARLEPDGVALKAAYANFVERGPGTLDSVVARERLAPAPLPLSGRASIRLANAVAVARALHGRASA